MRHVSIFEIMQTSLKKKFTWPIQLILSLKKFLKEKSVLMDGYILTVEEKRPPVK